MLHALLNRRCHSTLKEMGVHESARRAIAKFYFDYRSYLDNTEIADMGALNINGATKDIINCVGFDIVEGKGVDVVINPGFIPEEHKRRYGAVISANSFVFCPDPGMYKKQIIDLLAPNGLVFLITCSEKCKNKHTTSDNIYGFQDSFRVGLRDLEKFFSIEFDILELSELNYAHSDYVLLGRLKDSIATSQ